MRWRYEKETQTIRSVPQNHWIATCDSWEGAEDHPYNIRLMTVAPEMLDALKLWISRTWETAAPVNREAWNAALTAVHLVEPDWKPSGDWRKVVKLDEEEVQP